MFFALSTSTAKKQIREYRDQVVPPKLVTTAHAMASLLRQGLSLRDAIDTDIKEAAYHDPVEKDHDP
jgi:hypothetical protein